MSSPDNKIWTEYSRLLSQYADDLAAGRSLENETLDGLDDGQLAQRLREAQHCLEVLDRALPRKVGGGEKSEVGSQRSEVGSRKSEVGGRRSEVGSQKSDNGQEEDGPPLDDGDDLAVRRENRIPIGAIDEFELVREIGRGGMGVIYEAWQRSLHRRVALKVLPAAAMLDPRRLERFKNEARSAATLDHPHIVKVFAVGGEDRVPYFAMQYIDGRSLADEIDGLRQFAGKQPLSEAHTRTAPPAADGSSPSKAPQMKARMRAAELSELTASFGSRPFFQRAARLGIQVCEALEHAHAQGVIHRDIKPANLLVDERDWLWVADFGLARTLNDAGLTAAGDMLGTLRYASPEQALGKPTVDERSDVYSLGAALYELVTLTPMFPGEEREALLRAVVYETPAPPRRFAEHIPRDLETILLQATAKEAGDRYHSARAMADDLQAFLDQRPILARRASFIDRAVKWSRRNSVSVNVGLVTAALMLIAASVMLYIEKEKTRKALIVAQRNATKANIAQSREREAARAARNAAHAARMAATGERKTAVELAGQLYNSEIKSADSARWSGDPRRAAELVLAHDPAIGGREGNRRAAGDQRGFEWRFLKYLSHPDSASVRASEKALYTATRSPDGKTIVVAGEDAIVRGYDANSMRLDFEFASEQVEVNQVAFSTDGRLLATAGDNGWARIWDFATKSLVKEFQATKGKTFQAVFGRDGKTLFTAGEGSPIRKWDLESDDLPREFKVGSDIVHSIALSLDGRYLAAADDDGKVWLWNLSDASLVIALALRASATAVAFSPDTRWMATADKDGEVRVYETGQSEPRQTLEHRDIINGLCFSPDSNWLAVADRGGIVGAHPAGDGLSTRLAASGAPASAESAGVEKASPKSKERVQAQTDRYRSHIVANGLTRWHAHTGRAYCVDWSPHDNALCSVGDDGALRVWSPHAMRPVYPLSDGAEDYADIVAMPKEGQFAVIAISVDNEYRLRTIDANGGEAEAPPISTAPLPSQFKSLAMTRNGATFAWRTVDGERIEFGNVNDPNDRWNNRGERAFDVMAFSPDDSLLAATLTGEHYGVALFDVRSGEAAHRLPSTKSSSHPTFSPDGKWLAIDSTNNIDIWEIARRVKRWVLAKHDTSVTDMQFSPDSKTLASVSSDRTLKLWDFKLSPPDERFSIVGHSDPETCLAFAPDGKSIATADGAGLIKLWSSKHGGELCTLVNWGSRIDKLVFSPGGRYLAWNDGASLWVADAGSPVASGASSQVAEDRR